MYVFKLNHAATVVMQFSMYCLDFTGVFFDYAKARYQGNISSGFNCLVKGNTQLLSSYTDEMCSNQEDHQ